MKKSTGESYTDLIIEQPESRHTRLFSFCVENVQLLKNQFRYFKDSLFEKLCSCSHL